MNYTENYHLPQWEETDRIMRTDFNEAMSSLETGLTAAQGKADEVKFVIGHYSGSTVAKRIDLGFRPSLIVIWREYVSTSDSYPVDSVSIFSGDGKHNLITIDDTGFTLAKQYYTHPLINFVGSNYSYVAFR